MADDKLQIKKSTNHTLFLPAFIDDYGFTPEEFRVFSRIMRRSLGNGQDCFESIPNLATALMTSERLVRRALHVLEKCRAITRTVRAGKSDLYDFAPTEQWKPRAQLAAIRAEFDAETKRKDRERKAAKKALLVAETQGVTGCGNATTPLAETQPPLVAETPDEGTPSEGTPKREEENRRRRMSETAAAAYLERDTFTEPEESEPVRIYREFYGDIFLSPYQLDLINGISLAADRWRATLRYWKGKNNSATNIDGLVDRYRKESERAKDAPKMENGFIQHPTAARKFLH